MSPLSAFNCAIPAYALKAARVGIVLLLSSGVAAAQLPGAAGNDTQPVQIQADSGIEWQQSAHVYIARGNAVATRGTSEVHADTLVAHYREVKGSAGNTGGNTEIYRVEAEGHVTLKRDSQTVVGDHAVYDVDRAIAVVTGKNLKMTTATDIVTARDSLEWYDQKQIAVARGDAVAIRNGKTIKADILTAHMTKTAPPPPGKAGARPVPVSTGAKEARPGIPGQPASDSKISRVDAQGHVVIVNGPDTGRGDFGVYNTETGLATLLGNVVIERGKDVIRGQRAVMDLNKNVSRMLPGAAPGAGPQRVQGLFIRENQPGQAGGQGSGQGGAPARHKPAPSPEKKP